METRICVRQEYPFSEIDRVRLRKSEKVYSVIWGFTREKNGCFSLEVEALGLSKEIAIVSVSSVE